MPKFAANLNFLFTEVDFLRRFAPARAAGFRAVEFPFPYPYPIADVAAATKEARVEVVLFNLPPGNWEKGERGIACDPGRTAEFRDGVAKAIDYARALKCPRINCLSGLVPKDADPERVRATFVENLRYAAAALASEGVLLVIEPINPRTIPGFYLNTSRQALEIMRAVGSDNLKLQYDLFHMQIVEGDLAKTIEANLAAIGHVQFADVPDRHEPGTGELNFDFLFGWLDKVGYTGWVGAEYAPAKDTASSLGWLRRHSQ